MADIQMGQIIKVRGKGLGKVVDIYADRNGKGYEVEIAATGHRELVKEDRVKEWMS